MRIAHDPHRRGAFAALTAASIVLATLVPVVARAQSSPHARLETGPALERTLEGGSVEDFDLRLEARHYAHVVVEQRGIDVAVTLVAPDGKAVREVDSPNGSVGPEPLYFVSETGGDYILRVASLERDAQPGAYTVALVEERLATERDRTRMAAYDLYSEADGLRAKGDAESRRRAVEEFLAAAARWRELGDLGGEADSLFGAGEVLSMVGRNPESRDALERAVEICDATKNEALLIPCLGMLGPVYARLGDPRAVGVLQRSADLSLAKNNLTSAGAALHNLADVYWRSGDLDAAGAAADHALDYRTKADDRAGIAATYVLKGSLACTAGDLQTALEYNLHALAVEGRNRDSERSATNNVGEVYAWLGMNDEALVYLERALEYARRTGNRSDEATILSNVGGVLAQTGRYAEALERFRTALALIVETGDKPRLARIYDRISAALAASGEAAPAVEAAETALATARAVGNPAEVMIASLNLARALALTGDRPRALEVYREVVASIDEASSEARSSALAELASLELDMGQLDAASRHVDEALLPSSAMRARAPWADFHVDAESRHVVFATAIDVLMARHAKDPSKGLADEALRLSERARAQEMIDAVHLDHANYLQGVPPELTLERSRLRRALDGKVAQQLRLETAGAPAKDVEAARLKVAGLERELNEAEGKVRAASPAYASLTRPEPLTSAEISKRLLDASTALVEYSLGEKRSYVWVVTTSGLTSAVLPARAEIERLALRTRELLTARACAPNNEAADERDARLRAADAELAAASAALSDVVLAPIASAVAGRRLAIVADGALSLVPFAALPEPGAHGFVIERHEVVMLPSATALATLREQFAARPTAGGVVAVLADPVFDRSDPRVAAAASAAGPQPPSIAADVARAQVRGACSVRTGLDRLPGTRREADAIAPLAPSAKRLEATGFAANLDLATSGRLDDFRVVHFATHAYAPPAAPELSGLVLSLVDESGAEREGFLGLAQVYGLRLSADVVVLSACETGLGKAVRGDGYIGLVRGFMYAGSRRVVASLWRVDDARTADLMTAFYRGMLRARLAPEAALRRAQLEMIRNRRPPYEWAAFELSGEWR